MPTNHVAAVRRFNRFYTQQIGVLNRTYLETPFSLPEARVLYELSHHRSPPTATQLSRELGIDPGYLSRLLRDFQRRGLIARETSRLDARLAHVSLSAKGRRAFAKLDRRTTADTRALVQRLPATRRRVAIDAMRQIESAFGEPEATAKSYTIRSQRPGDMGWVSHRHGASY